MTLFLDIEVINEEATVFINEEVIGAINEAVIGVIIAPRNLPSSFLVSCLTVPESPSFNRPSINH